MKNGPSLSLSFFFGQVSESEFCKERRRICTQTELANHRVSWAGQFGACISFRTYKTKTSTYNATEFVSTENDQPQPRRAGRLTFVAGHAEGWNFSYKARGFSFSNWTPSDLAHQSNVFIYNQIIFCNLTRGVCRLASLIVGHHLPVGQQTFLRWAAKDFHWNNLIE